MILRCDTCSETSANYVWTTIDTLRMDLYDDGWTFHEGIDRCPRCSVTHSGVLRPIPPLPTQLGGVPRHDDAPGGVMA